MEKARDEIWRVEAERDKVQHEAQIARVARVAAHVETEERQREIAQLADQLSIVDRVAKAERERVRVLTEALISVRSELSHGGTANWEFIGQTFDRALAVSSTENERG